MDDVKSQSRRGPRWLLTALLAVATAICGGFAFERGLEARARVEPDRIVDLNGGRGLLPGLADASVPAEIRATALAVPAPHVARTGGGWRALGCALMAAGLGLAFVASLARARHRSRAKIVLPRLLWLAPGGLAVLRIATDASASAATVTLARDAFEAWLPAFGLSFLLLFAWRA